MYGDFIGFIFHHPRITRHRQSVSSTSVSHSALPLTTGMVRSFQFLQMPQMMITRVP